MSAGEWTPEFEGQRPPFEPGNTAAVKHGAHSPRVVEQEAAKSPDDLRERYPALAEHPETEKAIRRIRYVTNALFNDLVSGALRDKNGELRASTLSRYFTAENTFAKLRESAGMTPLAEMALARERAEAVRATVDLGALAARGRAALDARAIESSEPPRQDLPALATEAVTEHKHDREES